MTNPVRIFNPDLIKNECCGYGTVFVIDMLHDTWHSLRSEKDKREPLSVTCPSCGRTVYVDWNNETTWWEEPVSKNGN